jgi:hypothetical protein
MVVIVPPGSGTQSEAPATGVLLIPEEDARAGRWQNLTPLRVPELRPEDVQRVLQEHSQPVTATGE